MTIEVGWASRPMPGEQECGDRVLVLAGEEQLLVAVVDGLGHGPIAAQAACAAVDFVRDHPEVELADLFRSCGRAISSTRGVAMTVVRIRSRDLRMEHAGIGNVELDGVTREPVRPIPQPGVVGGRLRRINPTLFQLHPADRVILYSDGISSRLEVERYHRLSAQGAAEAILRDWAKEHDDATCAVIVC